MAIGEQCLSKIRYGRNRNLGGKVGDVDYRLKLYNLRGTQGDTATTASIALLLMAGKDWVQMKLFNNIGVEGPITYTFEEGSNGQSYECLYIIPEGSKKTQLSSQMAVSTMARKEIADSNFHGHIQIQGYPLLEFKRR
ncbi:hypothetical protein BX667DRAFT_509038 [Coemansia mojavensis]|nr:hypothetical protein BX667DRAFT_509038 [Coemansia mojavensis]